MFALLAAVVIAASPTPGPASSAAPSPSVPAYTLSGDVGAYYVATAGRNQSGALDTADGRDQAVRADVANALVTYTKNTGPLRFGITAGEYAFPTIGFSGNPTNQPGANTSLYGYVPQAYVAYAPNAALTFSVGQLATLLGQESAFTYQNVNIQRGFAWSAEPVFSRGVRVAYTQGQFTGDLEYDDGFYSGSHRAVAGLVGWAPTANTNLSLALVIPDPNAPPNPTASVANKREYDLMLTQNVGRLALTPYVLFISSPASSALGYTRNENALAASIIADYTFSGSFSLGARYESFVNDSDRTDTSLNADLLGFGPGSRGNTFTLTPELKSGYGFLRAEYSQVTLSQNSIGYGNDNSLSFNGSQIRLAIEAGVHL